MADTIPDIIAVIDDFIDVYTVTGISVGKELLVQNKSEYRIWIQESPIKPDITTEALDGIIVCPKEIVYVDKGSSGTWIRGNGNVNIQEV